ncbi:MAG: DNA mismatch repair protein MutS [Chloroflexi bacterium]|nr:DNA mismatch repair protein MutS [Chloroflexota bacterium]
MLAFLVAAVLGAAGLVSDQSGLYALSGLALLAFVSLIAWHRRVDRRRGHMAALADMNRIALARLARRWSEIPERPPIYPVDPGHPYAQDLDVVGHASLLHLLDDAGTHMGAGTLIRWLLGPAPPAVTVARSEAVGELAPRLDFREELGLRAGVAGERIDPAPLVAWAESRGWLTERRGLLWAARIAPLLLLLCLLSQWLGLQPYPLWLVAVLGNAWLASRLVPRAIGTIRLVSGLTDTLAGYVQALDLLDTTSFQSSRLRALQQAVRFSGSTAAAELRSLQRLTTVAQPTTSLPYLLIELSTLWNVHVLAALERWQARRGGDVRRWLAVLGEAEALSSLARLAHDNPDWAFASIDASRDSFVASNLAHPLLPSNVRVANDVRVGPPGTLLLVTGSNMSGKSTLLRAIGANAVLAQAGGPVCAARLALPPVALWTSMRVQDSLEHGVSHFMAELQRLKQVVDAAPSPRSDAKDTPRLLYLLDEILQGTNTAERQIAARRVIRLLLHRHAIGAVSTHDLTLAASPDLTPFVDAVHLSESVGDGESGPAMTFDYQLRPGIARSTNALRLMEMVGLPDD